jgi:signal transduction histidine kinase
MKNPFLKNLLAQFFLLAFFAPAVIASPDTEKVTQLVNEAGALITQKGEAAFAGFRAPNSRWRSGEVYVFVIDSAGNMLVHADPSMEGKNQLGLTDINGRPVIRGILSAALDNRASGGWYHYQWPVPGGLLPRWKSTYAKAFRAPDGKTYIAGSGNYDDRMERVFVADMVDRAVNLIEEKGEAGFPELHDTKGPFIAKDAYVFVIDTDGVELVNPGFPSLEGRNVMEVKDTKGKPLVREMFNIVRAGDSGWVEYLWPKPGESISTLKSTYVRKAHHGDKMFIVGCGVYLADAEKTKTGKEAPSPESLIRLVNEASAVFEKRGADAFPEFRKKDSKWFHGDTYFFVWTMDGKRLFHAANPEGEGKYVADSKDVLGRPWGRMFLETASGASGEGWVHYLYPEPGDLFPTWKSSFIKRVRFPDGIDYIIGCGIYNMSLGRAFIEDVVDRAAGALEKDGRDAFALLRDKTGPFLFIETYVFVDSPDGTELVNPVQPSLEGKNLMDHLDAKGKPLVKEYIGEALSHGKAWVDYEWYRPGTNEPASKHTYVRKVVHGSEIFIVGAGYYDPE